MLIIDKYLLRNSARGAVINLNALRYYLINLGVFLSTLPFVAPFPVSSDVQYPIFLVSIFIITIDLLKNKVSFGVLEIYFLWVSLLSLVYINPFAEYNYEIEKRAGLLFSFFLYYVYSRYWHLVNPKYILVGIYVNFFAVIFHLIFPGIFSLVAGSVTRVIKAAAGGRGVSGLAPESGFLGAMSIYFILISYVLRSECKITKRQFYRIILLSVIMLLLSKSGTGILLFFSLCGIYFIFSKIKIWKKILLISVAAVTVYILLFEFTGGGRAGHLARGLIENPSIVFIKDKSVAYRGIAFSVGITSIANGNILGHGVGTLSYVSNEILKDSYLGVVYKDVIARSGGLLSSMAQYLVEMGIFFIFLIVGLYFHARGHPYVIITRLMSVFYLIASFSILFPPLWILLASTAFRNSSKVSRI